MKPICPDCSRSISLNDAKCPTCGRDEFVVERMRHALWIGECPNCNDEKADSCEVCLGKKEVKRDVRLYEKFDTRIRSAISSRHEYSFRNIDAKSFDDSKAVPESLINEFRSQDPFLNEVEWDEEWERDEATGICNSCQGPLIADLDSCPGCGVDDFFETRSWIARWSMKCIFCDNDSSCGSCKGAATLEFAGFYEDSFDIRDNHVTDSSVQYRWRSNAKADWRDVPKGKEEECRTADPTRDSLAK